MTALILSITPAAHSAGSVEPTYTPGYILTPVEEPGKNTITKFEWNAEENKLTAVHYRVDLTKTEYGHKDAAGATAYYYKWTDNGNGLEFEQTTDPSEAVITYYADPSRLAPDRITTDQSGNPIDNDFIGQYVTSSSSTAYGGAIYNRTNSTIGDITGDFIGNYASGSTYAYGGAIYNYANGNNCKSTIGNIAGNFIGNYAASSGGAIYNDAYWATAKIGDITGDFIGNYATGDGGAIYNHAYSPSTYAYIGNITGNFMGNYTSGSYAHGGAIYNNSGGSGTVKIGDITGDFIGNYASAGSTASGGAIYNGGTIGDITGDFIGNYAYGSEVAGGAISSGGEIGNITGDFVGNYAVGAQMAIGGAIANAGIIGSYDVPSDKIIQVQGVTCINSETGESLTIYMPLEDSQKEALQNEYKAMVVVLIESVSPEEWAEMEAQLGPAIEAGMITTEPPVTEDQRAQLTGGLINSSFFGNYAKATEGEAKGGAIYTATDLMIAADNGNSVFSGNYVEDVNGKRPEAVYVDNPAATFALQAKNEGTILFDDQINGASGYKLKLDGDETGRVILNNDVINAKVDLNEVTLQLGREDVLNQSQALTLNSGTLSLLNNGVGTMHLPELSLNGAVNMAVDADLANKTMDRITADKYNISQDSKLNVNLINLISDAKEDKTDIEFADPSYSSQVFYTGDNPIAYSKIYKYDVSYNPEDGYFTFLRGGSSSNPSESFNPTVLSPAVTTQAAGYSTQMQVFNYAFQHSDNFMNLPYMDRLAAAKSNQYALINDSTVGPYSPIFTRVNQGGAWFKPYVSFENIPLKNGPTVDNIAYGSLIGYDSKLTPIRYGFERVLTGYVGYNGASQSYPGVDTYQNGGLLGGTVTLYKGNFFNATTLSAGASVGESSNMYGHENYTMLLAGIGNKLGYNFEFQRGRYILQPSMLMSYTFVNTFDYTNSAGTRMTSDPLHAIQLSPGLKFIMNTKNGWQPYAAVNMVWNIFTDQNAKADNISLPNMSIKPYVQYGLGVQKLIKDKFLAFGQALVSNGGRNGISFSFGLRWLIGRE